MKKILTIIGARPQIIKSAAISRAIKNHFTQVIEEVIVHTGQHYDEKMSAVFFEELQIPQPNYNLQVGSGKHGYQTARMIEGIEEILEIEKPNFVIIYGDTNSTLAAAIAAAKIHIPIVHIEAGLRSFNKKMPEEVNRILSDHVSTYLFPPTITAFENLQKEGFKIDNLPLYTIDNPAVISVGDVMYDNTCFFSELSETKTNIIQTHGLLKNQFVLATIHRNTNTDEAVRINAIFHALQTIADSYQIKIVVPLHPRTRKQMKLLLESELFEAIHSNPRILLLEPVSFLEMIQLEKYAQLVITDSGGVQKEAYFLKKPCIILRSETEWVEIVENGAALLCDADYQSILDAYGYFENKPTIAYQNSYGNGNAAESILQTLLQSINPQ
ncbi:MAG: UDP-N-acetylglucosamine 2-epimerase (non-hydrolyzing) [Cytophagia bacterium]|nr:MAG: UDP-N-acetylglucosamine 2-epimerase (non-hydrolyzing) [Runella sp.]TAG18312.1 MAG: UDP-N-acetylglucosamine 2-epimerase (non-hydrolyzing) [Cytophagales bacterium]TAG35583.1 MAG: UDP-N-acetylglucosamine 2-epimerase (non-hydrolyzing) [Cytophagia bacterium]